MERHWFSHPVRVWTRPGRSRGVQTVEDAAEIMLNDWPEEWKKAASRRAAMKAALAALEGEAKPDQAREAFERAAKEAKILDYQKR